MIGTIGTLIKTEIEAGIGMVAGIEIVEAVQETQIEMVVEKKKVRGLRKARERGKVRTVINIEIARAGIIGGKIETVAGNQLVEINYVKIISVLYATFCYFISSPQCRNF